jgi:MFS superfamily sulfate permease-like transporter
MGARAVNAILGLWLFLSTFFWWHTAGQRVTGWVIGLVVVTAALAGLSGMKVGRYVNAAAGGWLMLSAVLVRSLHAASFWNQILVGFALVFFAMAGNLRALRGRRADV